jgi:predicted nicotinamide N-methyase
LRQGNLSLELKYVIVHHSAADEFHLLLRVHDVVAMVGAIRSGAVIDIVLLGDMVFGHKVASSLIHR